MREFQERRRFKRFLHSRYAIAALILVLVFMGRAVASVHGKYQKSQELAEKSRADLAALVAREKELLDSIEALDTPEGREREVRDRFGAVKEGERLIILVDEGVEESRGAVKERSFWSSLFDWW